MESQGRGRRTGEGDAGPSKATTSPMGTGRRGGSGTGRSGSKTTGAGASGEAAMGVSVQEAGRRGGTRTAQTHGKEFYEAIGRKGGAKTSEKHGRTFYEEIGRKGGEARAAAPDVVSGELGRKGARARWSREQPTADTNGSGTGGSDPSADPGSEESSGSAR